MKTHFKFILTFFVFAIILNSCKDDEREGCTDISALNFNSLAMIDDGSCEYLDSSFTIWSGGNLGYWGNISTGSFNATSCFTGTSTIFLNPDSTFIPIDTTIDNNVTPPDTTITPADTIITGDTYLLVNSDSTGNYELILRLINKQSALDFKNGYLVFTAKMHPDALIGSFDVFIHGNLLNLGGSNCSQFHQSDVVSISTQSLDTSSFREITIPLLDFPNRHMQNIDIVFGIKGNNATPNNNLILIDKVEWLARLEE